MIASGSACWTTPSKRWCVRTAGHHSGGSASRSAFARAAPSRRGRDRAVPRAARCSAWPESPTIGTSAGEAAHQLLRVDVDPDQLAVEAQAAPGRGTSRSRRTRCRRRARRPPARSASRNGGHAMFSPACSGWPGGRMPLALTVLITGSVEPLGQRPRLGCRRDRAAAEHHQRPLGVAQQRRRARDRIGCGRRAARAGAWRQLAARRRGR